MLNLRQLGLQFVTSETGEEEEWFFPVSELVDGTVEGAMKAGLEAYPVWYRLPPAAAQLLGG